MTDKTNPRDGFRLITPLRVRYAECDLQGIVFNANYLAFADVGLTEYMRALVAADRPRDEGNMMGTFTRHFGGDNWVRHADVDFRAPAKADDLLDIMVNGALIAKGEVVTVNGRYGIRIIDIAATENRLAGIERRG